MILQPPIACFGGTFNPPHRAHFALAHAACAQLSLAQLLLIPAGQPWQKPQVLPAAHRLAMLTLALADDVLERSVGDCSLHIETLELDLPQSSYTIDTLQTLRQRMPDTPLVWLMGSDQLHNLTSWRDWQYLLDFAHIAVAQRAGSEFTAADLPMELQSVYRERVSAAASDWRSSLAGRFIPFDLPPLRVSSTAIRATLARGETPDALSSSVLKYIQTHNLYAPSL